MRQLLITADPPWQGGSEWQSQRVWDKGQEPWVWVRHSRAALWPGSREILSTPIFLFAGGNEVLRIKWDIDVNLLWTLSLCHFLHGFFPHWWYTSRKSLAYLLSEGGTGAATYVRPRRRSKPCKGRVCVVRKFLENSQTSLVIWSNGSSLKSWKGFAYHIVCAPFRSHSTYQTTTTDSSRK